MDWTDASDPVARPSLESLLRGIDADVVIGADIVSARKYDDVYGEH